MIEDQKEESPEKHEVSKESKPNDKLIGEHPGDWE